MDRNAEEKERKGGETYAQGKNTVFHWEINLQEQWHKCDFWTMLMFFNVLQKHKS